MSDADAISYLTRTSANMSQAATSCLIPNIKQYIRYQYIDTVIYCNSVDLAHLIDRFICFGCSSPLNDDAV